MNNKYDDIGISINMFNMDILDSGRANPNLNFLVLGNFNKIKVGGMLVKVILPELLAIMKLSVGRNKDDEDGFNLFSSGVLDKQKYLEYLNMLENFVDYEELKNYADLVI